MFTLSHDSTVMLPRGSFISKYIYVFTEGTSSIDNNTVTYTNTFIEV